MDRRTFTRRLALLAPAAALPAALATPTPAQAAPTGYGVLSWNVLRGRSNSTVRSEVAGLADDGRIDLMGFQECVETDGTDYVAAMDAALDARGWRLFAGGGDGGRAVPIAFRTSRFSFIAGGATQAHGGSAGRFPARWIMWVRLRDQTNGRELRMMNVHVNSGIDNNGTPIQGENFDKARIHIDLIRQQVVNAGAETVHVTGDFNVDAFDDRRVQAPAFPFAKLGPIAQSNYNGAGFSTDGISPTIGVRYVDYVWKKRDSLCSFQNHRTLDKRGSDHRPVLARYLPDA